MENHDSEPEDDINDPRGARKETSFQYVETMIQEKANFALPVFDDQVIHENSSNFGSGVESDEFVQEDAQYDSVPDFYNKVSRSGLQSPESGSA